MNIKISMRIKVLVFAFMLYSSQHIHAQVTAGQINQLLNLTADPNSVLNEASKYVTGGTTKTPSSFNASSYTTKNSEGKARSEEAELSEEDAIFMLLNELKSGQDSIYTVIDEGKKDSIKEPVFNPSKIFGHNYFSENNLALFTKSTDSKAPDNYILDSKDELNITVFGYSDYNGKFKVEPDGYITLPEFGRVYVKGLTFGAAKQLIRRKIGSFINLKSSNLEIALNYSRTINVNIVGSVRQPGTFVIPAINSVYNALNAAKGVSEMGSVRNIEVRRNGKTIKTFDLYEFLTEGKTEQDFFLQEGDFIYVPIANKVAQISGEVRRPMRYELLPQENLNDLLRYAGGLRPTAYTKVVQAKRYANNSVEIMDVKLAELITSGQSFKIYEGDIITIPTIPSDYDNYISIEGSVRVPGQYEYVNTYRISDLIKLADGLKFDAYEDRAYLIRTQDDLTTSIQPINLKSIIEDKSSPDNVLLKKHDVIEIFSKKDFLERFSVSLEGSVLKPTRITYSEGLTLNDVIFYGGGLKREAANNKIEISRVSNIDEVEGDSEPTRVIVKTVYVDNNLEIDAASKGFLLKPMDQVFVRKTYEFDKQFNVTLSGEVKYPGVYPILQKDERLTDLIERAGGLTPYAHTEASTLERMDKDIGTVILDLKEAFKDPVSRANYVLKANDVVDIPSINQLVSLSGAIRYPEIDTFGSISGKFEANKRAKYYVKKYGAGFDNRAKKTSTVVLNPNGSAGYTKKFPWFGRYPKVGEGATVSVDYKPRKEKKEKLPRDPINWNVVLPSIIVSVTTAASSIATILVVSKN